MLTLCTSNRMEILADMAAEVAASPFASPLTPELIVVPNRGMERWLSMRFSDRLGVWANARFLFPNSFVQELFRRVFADGADTAPYDPEILAWRIMTLLPEIVTSDERFFQLSSYLGDKHPLKRFQLSVKLADAFDQYMVFRPDMVLAWEQGKEDHWQAKLWRSVIAGLPGVHRARLWEAFFTPALQLTKEMLPERVIVFGHSSLPPYHVGILAAIAMTVPVHLFVLNPCAEFWDEIVTEREEARIQKKETSRKKGAAPVPELHLEQGNSLLAALGGYGRDFLALLHDYNADEVSRFTEPDAGTLLGAIQSDIVRLRSRGATADAPRRAVAANDRSIQVHSCHGDLREVEVLHDYLLDCFERKPDLSPSDILVMTPDIERYVPFIKAVFGAPEDRSREIPYSIADLPLRGENVVAEAFIGLLSLPLSRFRASEVLALLEVPHIRSAFAIEESDLDLITAWVRESGIRWGLDAPALASLGLPASPENTWEAGLERLLLGYALPSDGERHFGPIAGYDRVEGSEALIAGKLAEFVKRCSAFADRARTERTLVEWSELLLALVDDFFSADASQDLTSLRSLLHAMRVPHTSQIFTGTVDIEVVIDYIAAKLSLPDAHAPFLSGGVSLCAMMPMRSIPFKILCCIGMEDTAFPRRSYHPSWDLLAAKPRRGDRSLEREDRYLFLEAILSAREELYISFVGQNIRDTTIRRPSVVVEELLGYIDKGYMADAANGDAPPGGDAPPMRSRILTRHRLQPWSPAYFRGDDRYFSFSPANAAAAGSLCGATAASVRPAFCDAPLPSPPPPDFFSVRIDALARFFRNPAKFFCVRRLGMLIDEYENTLEETERFALEGLDRYRIAQDLATLILRGGAERERFGLLKARGDLPHGNVGRYHFDALAAEVGSFTAALRPLLAGNLPPLAIDYSLAAFHLSGTVEGLTETGRLAFRFAHGTPGDFCSLWISHLLLSVFAPPGYPKASILIVKDGAYRMEPLDDARALLEKLLYWYERGLTQPLRFFPKSSYAYAKRLLDTRKPCGPDEALDAALAEWNGGEFTRGERNDPYFSFCFREGPTRDEAFTRPATELFGPLLDHLRIVEGYGER